MLAVSSSLAIGASFVITKKGLNASMEKHGFDGDGFAYLRNPTWWAGITTMVLGEIFNFAAYAFAPAILVTPLGALSVLIGAVLGSYFLDEQLGLLGKIGCAICLIGSVIIVLHAPPDAEVNSVDDILNLAIQPGFLFYCLFVAVFSIFMIYKIAPKQEPIHASFHLCVYNHDCRLHHDPDELLQQGAQPVLHQHRQPSLLCHLHNMHTCCLFPVVPGLQHNIRRKHNFSPLWFPHHLLRRIPPQSLSRRSKRQPCPRQLVHRWTAIRRHFWLPNKT